MKKSSNLSVERKMRDHWIGREVGGKNEQGVSEEQKDQPAALMGVNVWVDIQNLRWNIQSFSFP
jgi:hypothetical protein